jgi:GTP cyclohydrolase II
LTNRPSRIVAVDGFDLEVVEQVLMRGGVTDGVPDATAAARTTH